MYKNIPINNVAVVLVLLNPAMSALWNECFIFYACKEESSMQ